MGCSPFHGAYLFAKHVQFGLWQRLFELTDQAKEIVAQKSRFASGDGQIVGFGIHEPDELPVPRGHSINIIPILRRLRTHQAITIAPLRNKKGVMLLVRPVQRPDEARGYLKNDDIAVLQVV